MRVVGRYVLRTGHPEYGVGKVVEVDDEGLLVIQFRHAEGGPKTERLGLGMGHFDVISEAEARGRLYAAD